MSHDRLKEYIFRTRKIKYTYTSDHQEAEVKNAILEDDIDLSEMKINKITPDKFMKLKQGHFALKKGNRKDHG